MKLKKYVYDVHVHLKYGQKHTDMLDSEEIRTLYGSATPFETYNFYK